MAKELFVSSSPHETKVAVLEDDQLVEVYYERATDTGLVGGIYKGRVSRVLPGMQSAFVNIGLERDAFLYVSDFVEDEEEYDKIFSDAEARATRFVETGQVTPVETPPAPPPAPPAAEAPVAAPTASVPGPEPSEVPMAAPTPPPSPPPARPGEQRDYRRQEPRGRSRRRGGRRDFRFTPKPEVHERGPADWSFEILPGESLAKYRGAGPSVAEVEPPALTSAGPAASEIGGETAPEVPPSTLAEGQVSAVESPAPVDQSAHVQEVAEVQAASETTGIFSPAQLGSLAPPQPEPAVSQAPQPAAMPAPSVSEPLTEAAETDSTAIFSPVQVFTPAEMPPPQPPEEARAATATATAEPTEAQASAEPASLSEPAGVGAAPGESTEASVGEGEEQEALESAEEQEEGEAVESEAGPDENMKPVEPMPAPASETVTEPPEKKYILREPYQRPRFAPRRRRGRRGLGRRPERTEPSRPGNYQPVQISDLLKEGQEIIVQIAKEPLGTKGARITSHIALPGRYLVFMPTISHIGVSRKITSEEERLRLRNIILENRGSLTGGFIVRTAGAGRSEEEFKTDLKFLSTLWNEIRSKAERTRAPALLHRDLDLVQRILRDILSPDFKQVRVDNEVEYERCVEFVNRCQPSLVGHVKLYTRPTPMFEEFGIQQEVDKALRPKVWLKSGGYIVINQTEALVAIDVNTGKFVGKTNRLEDTIVKTNVDAVNEIVRQIRLRDLGGIIVIDFIDMDERKNRLKVVQALEEALRRDRAPTKILSFNDFGLVALTRKRVKQSLERTLCQPCNYCSGSGWVKSVTTICYEIMGEVKKMARELEGDTIRLRVNPDVAQALKSRQGALLSELEAQTHKDIIVKGDPLVHQERFEIY